MSHGNRARVWGAVRLGALRAAHVHRRRVACRELLLGGERTLSSVGAVQARYTYTACPSGRNPNI
jgi:hypothetical protein